MRIIASKNAGFGRLGCFGLVLMLGLLWGGGQGIYVALKNRQPTTLSFAEYVKTKPKAEWLVLTNCVLNVAGSAYRVSKDSSTPALLYVPVIASLKDDTNKVHVILATKDPELISTVTEMEKQKSDTAVLLWIAKNPQRAFVRSDISGLVQFGIDQKDSDRKKLASLQGDLADDFIIIKQGSKPDLMISSGMLAGGILLAIILFRRSDVDSED